MSYLLYTVFFLVVKNYKFSYFYETMYGMEVFVRLSYFSLDTCFYNVKSIVWQENTVIKIWKKLLKKPHQLALQGAMIMWNMGQSQTVILVYIRVIHYVLILGPGHMTGLAFQLRKCNCHSSAHLLI